MTAHDRTSANGAAIPQAARRILRNDDLNTVDGAKLGETTVR